MKKGNKKHFGPALFLGLCTTFFVWNAPEVRAFITKSEPSLQIDIVDNGNESCLGLNCINDITSNWLAAGPDRLWRYQNITLDNFDINREMHGREISFPDISEQPAISGFERSIYTTPK